MSRRRNRRRPVWIAVRQIAKTRQRLGIRVQSGSGSDRIPIGTPKDDIKLRRHHLRYLVIMTPLLSGCVGIENVKNWRPQTTFTQNDYDQCFKGSQFPPSPKRAGFGSDIYCDHLLFCMRACGYELRSESVLEMASDVILLPIWFFSAMGGSCFRTSLIHWYQPSEMKCPRQQP